MGMDSLSISQVSVATLLLKILLAYNEHLFLGQRSVVGGDSSTSASNFRSGSGLLSAYVSCCFHSKWQTCKRSE